MTILPILANTITADMGLIPGLAGIGPAMGLPLSVMAAFIERPFYSLAGIAPRTIWYSLQANLISLLLGFVFALCFACLTDALRAYDSLFTIWPFLAVAISIVVERTYLKWKLSLASIAWSWTIAGNILSASVCVVLLFAIQPLRTELPVWREAAKPWVGWLNLIALLGSIALFIVAFMMGPKRTLARSDVDN